MSSKKVIASTILTVLVVSGLFGLYSDNFILGSYTYLRGGSGEIFFQYLSEANYNCHNANITDESIQSLYRKSDDHNLDIILNDMIWQPENEAVGVYKLTSSNNYYYEAEYSDTCQTFPEEDIPDKYYYRIFRDEDNISIDLGEAIDDQENGASNGFVWYCDEDDHDAGVVCDTLFWKWQRSGVDKHVEKEILLPKFINGQDTLFIMDILYIEFQLKIDDLSHPDNTPICDLNFYISTKEGDHYIQNNLTLNSCSPFVYDNQLTVGEYNAVQSPTAYKTFTFYALIDEIDENLIFDYDSYHPVLKNINFKVYWHGNGNLYLDCFRLYDDVYRKLKDEVYDNMLVTRVNSLTNPNAAPNIRFMYSKDEPSQPQFDSYRLVENILNTSLCDSLITATYNKGYWCGSTNGVRNYAHHELFEYISEPEQIMLDYYPIVGKKVWNCVPNLTSYHIQDRIQNMMIYYKEVRELCDDKSIDFICIPQTFGSYYPNHCPDDPNRYWGWLRPPNKMQRCLQFLPLCYDSDGLNDFKFMSSYNYTSREENYMEPVNTEIYDFDLSRNNYHLLALIDTEGDIFIRTPQYYAIQEANQEIITIAPIIKDAEWLSGGTIEINDPEFPDEDNKFYSTNPNLDYIEVNGADSYSGYVECGEYIDNFDNYLFMVVNRITEFSKLDYTNQQSGYTQNIPMESNLAFTVADSQEIKFHFTTDPMENDCLVDQYSGVIYEITNNVSKQILIEPGDGILLKLCQLPAPEVIDGTLAITNVYIPYSLTIVSGGKLYIGDNVVFGPYADVTVQEGGNLYIYGNTYFGTESEIEVYGTIKINHESLAPITVTAKYDKWQGIDCFEGGQVWVENEAIIENAETGIFCESGEVHILNSEINFCQRGIMIYNNSSLDFISSDILIPADINARGIVIVNSLSECSINISGTEADSVYIQGEYETQIGKGILIYSFTDNEENSFICNYAEFSNLDVGIQHLPYCRTDHEIENCKFENCDIGIQLLGTGSLSKIEDCDFIGNNNFGCGVNQNTVKTKINNCRFDDNYIGIDYANSQQGPQLSTGVFNSYFGYNQSVNVIDLRCSDTSPEVENCIFKSTIGILSVNNSNVNASFDANNVFLNTDAHLMFAPDSPSFSSGILLHRGHNDFYDENDDFIFLSNYNGSEITIDADGNWWEDFDVDINDEAAIAPPMIIAERKDPEPNVPFFINPGNRFESASQEESLGNNETALNSFKEILNDKLENEKIYWGICIDKVFNLSIILEEDINVLLNFYEVLYQSPPEYLSEEEKSSLQTILKNYQKKCHIEQHEYQEAADIVVERINNPISSVDSLFAVMQLETIYTLSEMDSTSRSSCVHTNYDRLAPKSLKEHNQKHKNHWDEIYALLGIGGNHDDEVIQNIPLIPTLFGNYPNPFNPTTTISFSIPKESKVDITMYNIKGQKVKTLTKDFFEKGFHKLIWNSKDLSGKEVGSGVYFYKLKVNGKDKSMRKCLLLK